MAVAEDALGREPAARRRRTGRSGRGGVARHRRVDHSGASGPILRIRKGVTRATRVVLIALLFVTPARQVSAQPSSLLLWGCDPEGGSPYVEADPSDPSRQVGFEVDIASLVAAHIGRQPKFSFVAFSSINQSLKRGDFEVSFCGLEEITARRTGMAATVPYYQFREVLTVRAADTDRFRSLEDLRGRSVATLAATQAYELVTEPKY